MGLKSEAEWFLCLFFSNFIKLNFSDMTVEQILNTKGRNVYSVRSTTTVFEALKVMGEKNIGAILVIDGSDLKGILSERDYARKIVLKDKSSKETFVHEIMESHVFSVKLSNNIEDCMELMSTKRIRHLPVLENEIVVGIISISDVVKAIIEIQKDTINHLNSYISQ